MTDHVTVSRLLPVYTRRIGIGDFYMGKFAYQIDPNRLLFSFPVISCPIMPYAAKFIEKNKFSKTINGAGWNMELGILPW